MGVLLVVGLVAVLYAVNAVQTSHPCTIHAHMHTCTCSRPRTPCTRSTMTATVLAKTPSRYAPHTPTHSRIQPNTSAPDRFPIHSLHDYTSIPSAPYKCPADPPLRLSCNPLASRHLKPSAPTHTHLHPTCQHTHNLCLCPQCRSSSVAPKSHLQPLPSPLCRLQGGIAILGGVAAFFIFTAGARVREYDL